MENLPVNILFFFELTACVTGIFYYNKLKTSYWKYFPLYLIFIVCSEIFGRFLLQHYPYPKCLIYNTNFFTYFEIPVEFLFFIWLFYISGTNNRQRIIPVLCAVIYLISLLSGILFFIAKYQNFDSVSYTIGNLALLILILRFFVRLVSSDELVNFRENKLFWVCLGLLLFYLGSFPYYNFISLPDSSFVNLIGIEHQNLFNVYKNIVFGLNSLMYIMFTVSFIWGKTHSD